MHRLELWLVERLKIQLLDLGRTDSIYLVKKIKIYFVCDESTITKIMYWIGLTVLQMFRNIFVLKSESALKIAII